ncbi:MAG: hypothetical protein Q8R28_12440, partial [Dehalococcoidia bacterium]|nr:hypothetical protein [Dehalococcoidia bacterium]
DLKDTDASAYRWTDAVLDRHIAHALKELSQAIPREQKATIATTSGSRAVSVATLADLVLLWAVEYPVDKFPPSYQRFALFDQVITLLGDDVPTGANCYVFWGKLHTLDASTSTVPAMFEDVLAMGASAYALLEYAAYTLNRVNVGGGKTEWDYRREGERRLKLFHDALKRNSYKNRIRTSRMYPPYEPKRSQSTDWGP